MLKVIKQVFAPQNKDLRRKILFTLGILLVFKFGTVIPVPGTQAIVRDLGFLELMNAMGGGAIERFSIFALGISPYISASIITQILQMDIIPYFSELKSQGASGRKKINQINRYLGIIIAFFQGYVFSFTFFGQNGTPMDYLRITIILTAGTAFVLWLSDQITQKGIGNGVSLLIMAGIVSSLPNMLGTAFTELVNFGDGTKAILGIISFVVFILIYLGIIIAIIYMQQAERRIPVQYANRTTSSYGGQQTYMPIKINSAGVMPVIFASMFISLPTALAQFINNKGFSSFVDKFLNYNSPAGLAFYLLMILLFTFVYILMNLNPKELSSDLNKRGGYIPGTKPGNDTTKYIKYVLIRITVIGALFLVVIAGLPIIFTNLSKLPASVTVGGTGLLIVVGVALELYNQIENSVVERSYKRSYKK
ncbi:MAG: preprotein translocase subunit SecY [Tenericutes bacterium]|nr:preprotein translocase subunit SecY [Mycoplasmatota bacterium]